MTSTAFIEPLSTREKYRHKGFARQMIYGIMIRLKEMGIENAYRKAGFVTEDSISCWYKKI